MKAIVYTSNTGSAESYAQLLSQNTGLPAYPADEAKKKLAKGTEIIYLGWIMASTVKGYKNAAKRYNIRAVCGVGMCKSGTQIEQVREKSEIPADTVLFTMQGNFNVNKLSGIYKMMMNMMSKALEKELSEKSDRTAEEENMLDMMRNGGERVSAENLCDVLDWYGRQNEG